MLPFRSLRGAFATLLAMALIIATPAAATAAVPLPGRPGLIDFVGASLTSSGATLTVDWPNVAGATGYDVFWGTSLENVDRQQPPQLKVSDSKATITRLAAGRAYFVQVRATNSAGYGPKGSRVAHETIAAQAALPAGSPQYRALTWNICSNACSGIASRARVINTRIKELAPDVVALQEASRYTQAPVGYRHVYNGQNDILVRGGVFSLVGKNSRGATTGTARFASRYAASGKGLAWAALKHRSGAYVLVVNTHLVVGDTASKVRQREYEAGRLPYVVRATLAKLAASHGSLTDWTKAPVIILGDMNTHKSRSGEDTQQILENLGWHDAFDQARRLNGQHRNTANPDYQTKPVIGGVWGDHVDKVLVRPSRSVVYGWANAGKMRDGRYVTPFGSDHHPLLVRLGLR